MGRSLRELGFVAFLSGLVHETENAWREGLAIRRDLGDQQGIADSLYFLSVLCLVRGDWQQGRTMAEQVTTIAPNIDESVYQKWASRALEIATSMEHAKQSSSEASPGVITTFTAELAFYTFGWLEPVRGREARSRRRWRWLFRVGRVLGGVVLG